MGKLVLILSILCSISAFAQLKVVENADTTDYKNVSHYLETHSSKEGYFIFLSSSNTKKKEGNYVNNNKEGIWKKYFNSGKIESEITYVADKADGYAKIYYENGNLSEEGIWKGDKWVGEYKYYFQNGNTAYEWNYNEQGKRTGSQKYFYENGFLMIEGDWQNGKESGAIKEYYEDGSLKSEKTFADGKLDETKIVTYRPQEKPVFTKPTVVTRTVADIPEDQLKAFDGNGYYKTINKWRKTEYEGVWKGGKFMDGERHIYDEEGKYVVTLIFRNGIKIGEKVVE